MRSNKPDLASTWALLEYGWLGSNPRLGQTVTTLLYTPGPYHLVFTPLLELGLFWLMTTIALGRWPSVRRADDAMVLATVTAITALCTPQFGPMLFYRPFTGNYTFGLVLNLLWLVPYRLHVEQPRSWHWWWAPLLFVLGVAAGMCNEHTGPTFLALGALAVAWSARRGHGIKAWMIAGLLGLLAGYILLIVAPGHDARYGRLAKEAGIVERVLDRGVLDNLRVIGMVGLYMVWSVPWIVLALVARAKSSSPPPLSSMGRTVLLVLGAAGLFTTFVLLASPKLGPRLYLASVALLAIAVTGWVVAHLTSKRARIACVALSGLVLLYVGTRCVLTYWAVGPIGKARVTAIQGGWGADVVVPRYPVARGKWFLGEDLGAANLREALAADYVLKSLTLAP